MVHVLVGEVIYHCNSNMVYVLVGEAIHHCDSNMIHVLVGEIIDFPKSVYFFFCLNAFLYQLSFIPFNTFIQCSKSE